MLFIFIVALGILHRESSFCPSQCSVLFVLMIESPVSVLYYALSPWRQLCTGTFKKKKKGEKRRYFPYWPGNASPLLLVLIAVVHILYTHRHLWGYLHQENIVAELWNRVELIRLSMAGIPLSIMNNS